MAGVSRYASTKWMPVNTHTCCKAEQKYADCVTQYIALACMRVDMRRLLLCISASARCIKLTNADRQTYRQTQI